MRVQLLSPTRGERREARIATDDRNKWACHECAYFDTLLKMRPGPRIVSVIAEHIRDDHEPPA